VTLTTIRTCRTRTSDMRRLAVLLERTEAEVKRSSEPPPGRPDGMGTGRTLIAEGDVLHWNNGGGDIRIDLSLTSFTLILSFKVPTRGSLDDSPIHPGPNDGRDPRIPLMRMLAESARVVRAALDPVTTMRGDGEDEREGRIMHRLRHIGAAMQHVDPAVLLDKGLTVTAPGPVTDLTIQGVRPDASGGLDWRSIEQPAESSRWWRDMPTSIAVLKVEPPAPRHGEAGGTFDRDAWTVEIGPASIEWQGEDDPVVLMRMLSELER